MKLQTVAKISVIGLLVSWGPLFVVGGLGISDNPIGLGLLGLAGSAILIVLVPCLLLYVAYTSFIR
jgi:hypothetical protein